MEEGIEIYGYSDTPKTPHAAIRAKERYGVELSNDDLQAMSNICQDKTWMRDYQQNLGNDKHHIHIWYKGIWFNIIWCSQSKIVCTILHPKHHPQPKDK